jgi:hypothetical protein
VDRVGVRRRQRLAQIDALDLGTDVRSEWTEINRHDRGLPV